jgi:alanine-glyoxylate transaminase/serine-glyoxylate transaminase/serine-pyruvate transaminase
MAKPVVGHLDPYFFSVVEEIRAGLRTAFGTTNDFTCAISGTGSAGMETAICNFVDPGSKFLVFANGFFCDRIVEMGKRHGGQVIPCEKPWGESFDEQEVRDAIRRERPQVVAFVQAETSTGVFNPGKAISDAAHEIDALVLADTVTSLGTMPVEVDKNGIDVAFSCTQKGMSCPPGLSPITVSPRALEKLRSRKRPADTWYLDLKLLDDYYDGSHRYHHTAPISLFYALNEGLAVINEEGIENRWKRHHEAHHQLVKGLEALGLSMFVPQAHRIWNLNTPRVPEGVDDTAVRKHLMTKYGIEVLGGFGQLAGKVFRIGLMGPLATPESTEFFLRAFGEALAV